VEDAAEDYARKLRQVGPGTGRKAVKDCGRDDCLGTQTVTMVGRLGLEPYISGTLICRPEVLVH
jgi:hypothetical protein